MLLHSYLQEPTSSSRCGLFWFITIYGQVKLNVMSSQNILAKNIPLDVGASVINEEKMSTSSYDGPLSSDENGTMTAVYVLGNGEPLLSIIKHLEKLEGKVLTVIDATFIDEKRSKYVKDLIKDAFSNSSNWLYELSIRNFKEEQKNKK